MTRIIYIVASFALLIGCAHDSGVMHNSAAATVAVDVTGGVNHHGLQTLARPFTVDHAIQQAGGLELYEQDLNRKVLVKHKDGSEISVRRVDYSSFILADGDEVIIPRH